jgi:hypothetical protein
MPSLAGFLPLQKKADAVKPCRQASGSREQYDQRSSTTPPTRETRFRSVRFRVQEQIII